MGTEFVLVADGSDGGYLSAVAQTVFEEWDRLDAQLSRYRPASELSAINRNAATGPVRVESALGRLLERALRWSAETDGAFDITATPLTEAWSAARKRNRAPSAEDLRSVRALVGYGLVAFDPIERTVRFAREGVTLDLGGIAKGYAVDRAVALLREYRVDRALVSSGTSSVYALGAPPDCEGWPISIRDPRDAERSLDRLILRDGAISTSGAYEQAYTIGGTTYGHLIDPASGSPVTSTAATVVVTRNATDGDALSTAWYILGRDRALACRLSESPILALFYLHDEGRDRMRRFVERGPAWDSGTEVRVRLEDPEGAPDSG